MGVVKEGTGWGKGRVKGEREAGNGGAKGGGKGGVSGGKRVGNGGGKWRGRGACVLGVEPRSMLVIGRNFGR